MRFTVGTQNMHTTSKTCHVHHDTPHSKSTKCNVLVTEFPWRLKNSNFGQAFPNAATWYKDDIRLLDRSTNFKFGTFLEMLESSIDSMRLPDNLRLDNRSNLGKLSRCVNRLSVKSMASWASLVTAKCSIAGMAKPRSTISRSPNGFVRCSAEPKSSADNLMIQWLCCYVYVWLRRISKSWIVGWSGYRNVWIAWISSTVSRDGYRGRWMSL